MTLESLQDYTPQTIHVETNTGDGDWLAAFVKNPREWHQTSVPSPDTGGQAVWINGGKIFSVTIRPGLVLVDAKSNSGQNTNPIHRISLILSRPMPRNLGDTEEWLIKSSNLEHKIGKDTHSVSYSAGDPYYLIRSETNTWNHSNISTAPELLQPHLHQEPNWQNTIQNLLSS